MNGTWSVVDIAGKPADVYDPPGGRPRFGMLYLHPLGLETLPGNEAFTTVFDELRLACVCPHGGYSWWSDRICLDFDAKITAERYLLYAVLPFFQTRWELAPPAIGAVGISMGGQGALRLALKHPRLFPAVAGIASALDYHELYGRGLSIDEMYDSKEQCRQDTALLHIHPSHSPPHIFFCIDSADADWYRGNDRLHEKMAALGVAHECDLTTRAGGHSWEYFNHMAGRALRFVTAGLEQEARRLL
jgi:pimeloyl-ACP methyl ester carboxylesterase